LGTYFKLGAFLKSNAAPERKRWSSIKENTHEEDPDPSRPRPGEPPHPGYRGEPQPTSGEAIVWNVDQPHTEINFTVKHFFTPVTGTFGSYDVEFRFDRGNPANSTVKVSIDVASVDTNNERRDNHLRSGDFFNAEAHPTMTFESTAVRQVAADQLVATGDLTIKGITREVELPITILGITDLPAEMQEMLGGVTQVASFEAGTKLDRREFEVGVANWAQTVIVGGEVEVSINLEANRK
jgi:polyisoprenoid-binding protein YceI